MLLNDITVIVELDCYKETCQILEYVHILSMFVLYIENIEQAVTF